jgi:hypothetical protein
MNKIFIWFYQKMFCALKRVPGTYFNFKRELKLPGLIILLSFIFHSLFSQTVDKLTLKCGLLDETIKIDGKLSENIWDSADSISSFIMVEPNENQSPTYRTIVKILAGPKDVVIGITCYDNSPDKIVSFSKARDTELGKEDNIKIVLDTYQDGRNGFIFSVNPDASRYDALVSNYGVLENANWDGIWEAKTFVSNTYWSLEIRIPLSTITFKSGLHNWGFNVERRIQRLMEVDRWSGGSRDYKLGQTIHAGLLTNLPDFNLGIGLTPKISVIGKAGRVAGETSTYKAKTSLDLIQKITPDITAQVTVNTDFAETEVDSRKTNLTRFAVLYPEKRQFFLEGADIYDFGVGMGSDLIPFFSRNIGLYNGQEVPVRWGGKLNGKINKTNFGMLVNQTGVIDDIGRSTMGALRIKQNFLKESSIGVISTIGDPAGRKNSWTSGADMTFKTSTFRKDKNFLVGIWGLMNGRDSLKGEKGAYGLRVSYPNDLWDISLAYTRIGDTFTPSLGFVPRPGVTNYAMDLSYKPRPGIKNIRQFFFETHTVYITDLNNNWESYSIFTTPVNIRFESGDRIEFDVKPAGESLKQPFEISKGVIIPAGKYQWLAYRAEAETASKRSINGLVTYWFGGFYGGIVNQLILQSNWRILPSLIVELNYERSKGYMPTGDFIWNLFGARVQLNFNSNLNLSSYVQYDDQTKSLGSYSRLRWTFTPRGDLFIVYKYNIKNNIMTPWEFESNQLIMKLSYSFDL